MIDVSPDKVFEVLSLTANTTYTVKLPYMSCTCFEWESTGIPCAHAIAAILFDKDNPQTYTHAFFSLDDFRRTYANAIFAPNADAAENTPTFINKNNGDIGDIDNPLIPPHVKSKLDRPRKRRIRSEVEGPFGTKRSYKCTRCDRLGYKSGACDSEI